ncbi:type IV secretion system protein [Achromobacter sp. 413638]|uniref:type IV secretion system protein n=1 Tax=Achromobacter sp. 413638 TaxID=3342385 RepID=UPI00370A32AD
MNSLHPTLTQPWRARIAAALAMAFLTQTATPAHAVEGGIPVTDGVSIAARAKEHAISIAKYIEQITTLKAQLTQQTKQLEALTGTRDLGGILNNPAIRRALPDDVQAVLRNPALGNEDLVRKTERIVKEERMTGDYAKDRAAIDKRAEDLAVRSKAMLESAQAGTTARAKQIDQLQAQINLTTDPKSIADLQARMLVEQANIQADQTRADLLTRQLQAEQALMQQQADKLAAKSFSVDAIRAPIPWGN